MINAVRAKLSRGEPVLGLWSVIASPMLVELFGVSGFDFIILDQEHGAYDLSALENAIRAAETGGYSPWVRVPPDQFSAQRVLDLGAHGLVVPQSADAAEARKAVALSKFPPIGIRGFNPFTRAGDYNPPKSIPHGKLDDNFVLTCLIVETLGAFHAIDAIVALPGLDVIYLGQYDMANALGCAGDTRHPKVLEFIEICTAKARASGKAAAIMVRNADEVKAALSLGVQVLVYGVDTFLAFRAATAAVGEFRNASAR